jgi:anti-sigma regulatory factor (Ser/Thr protein kinase)
VSSAASASSRSHGGTFRHEALLYSGMDGFVAETSAFLRDGVAAGEPMLVVVDAEKIGLLREELGSDADAVCFADMADVGANPARIIPAWRQFVADNGEAPRFRGIGEPIWAGRTPDELIECQRHESLLNVAFADSQPWWLLCPYDLESLDERVIEEAQRSHPFVMDGASETSPGYAGLDSFSAPFDAPLPDPPADAIEVTFGPKELFTIRSLVRAAAMSAGLGRTATHDLVLSVNEVTTNSLRYGGGRGTVRIWQSPDALVCEIADDGRIADPLIGRVQPRADRDGGRGLWLVNQLCDLVQLRNFADGTVVRIHMRARRRLS